MYFTLHTEYNLVWQYTLVSCQNNQLTAKNKQLTILNNIFSWFDWLNQLIYLLKQFCTFLAVLVNLFFSCVLSYFFAVIGDRPSSQMSFLEQFLKESSVGRSRDPLNSAASGSNSGRPDRVSVDSSTATAATRRGMSIESDEGDVEDNRAGSIASSRSNMSEVN